MTRGEEEVHRLIHEVRTPLAVIAGYAELLKTRPGELDAVDAAGRILEAADRLSALITELAEACAT